MIKILSGDGLEFDDVLIRPTYSEVNSRSEVELLTEYKTMRSGRVLKSVPIIAANMDTVGTISMAQAFSQYQTTVCLHKFYSEQQLIEFFNGPFGDTAWYTMGMTAGDLDKIKVVAKSCTLNKICIDVANGYISNFHRTVKSIRNIFPNAIIMAGNVVTAEGVKLLLNSGADIVKCGLGSGGVCSTRKVTGVGVPQLSAIIECAEAANNVGGLICSDGGCKIPADIVKALAAGSHLVMCGGLFAGCNECEGEWVEHNGSIPTNPLTNNSQPKQYLKFYGMSSEQAMQKYNGGVADYRAAEGECTLIEAKGPVSCVLQQVLGGIRSACTYVGCSYLQDFNKHVVFMKVK